MGVVSHLLRIGDRKACQWRSAMAKPHGNGRVLPERTSSDMDRLVHAASATLVSLVRNVGYAGDGAPAGLDDVLPQASAYHVFRNHVSVADTGNTVGKLHIPELPRSRTRVPTAG